MKSKLATTPGKMWCYTALVVIIFASMLSASAQAPTSTPQPSPTPSLERKFLRNILRDQRAIWTSPLHVQKKDAKWLAPLGLSTATLIATDRRTAGALHEDRLRLNISRDISYLGSGYGTGAVAAAFYVVGRKTGKAWAKETGILGAEALIDSGIVATVLKTATERRRPRAKEPGDFFEGGLSFPSGHTIASWSLATVVANEYRSNRLVQVTAYGLATVVSMSRFTGRNHFLSDVLVGSAIGYGIGRYVYRTHHDPALEFISQETPHGPSKLLPLIVPRYERAGRSYGVAFMELLKFGFQELAFYRECCRAVGLPLIALIYARVASFPSGRLLLQDWVYDPDLHRRRSITQHWCVAPYQFA